MTAQLSDVRGDNATSRTKLEPTVSRRGRRRLSNRIAIRTPGPPRLNACQPPNGPQSRRLAASAWENNSVPYPRRLAPNEPRCEQCPKAPSLAGTPRLAWQRGMPTQGGLPNKAGTRAEEREKVDGRRKEGEGRRRMGAPPRAISRDPFPFSRGCNGALYRERAS